MLLSGQECREAEARLPGGVKVRLPLEEACRRGDWVSCGVKKDAGDDPDVTDGLLICARVSRRDDGAFCLSGGEGVGKVTRPGLKLSVGEDAINPVPRQMILEAAKQSCRALGYEGGLDIAVYVPGGQEAAAKTFNGALGIVGGISILGTTGIVEPMSERALVESIRVEIQFYRENTGRWLLAVPGNYGEAFVEEQGLAEGIRPVKCSNYVGEMLDAASELGMEGVLLVAHAGKFVKLAAGMLNTHSSYGDARMEILCAHAVRAGASAGLARRILDCVSSDAALELLQEAGLLDRTMASVTETAGRHLRRRAGDGMAAEAVVYSQPYGILGKTSGAERLLEKIRGQACGRG